MWAFGVLMHELAVAYKPTNKPNFVKYPSESPKERNFTLLPYNAQDWSKRDPLLLDLIYKCLQEDPNSRITAKAALEHGFIT